MSRRPPTPAEDGSAARRAALQMLDAVLRRDMTLEAAAPNATRGLDRRDSGLASAIAGETLRRLPDLDAMIDGAMARPLPEDAKARMVLRMAIAQWAILDIPEHAVIATSLSQMAKGPRRLVHGVLSTLFRQGKPDLSRPSLPDPVAQRWADWGGYALAAASRMLGERPPLDISLAGEGVAAPVGETLVPLQRRVASDAAVPELAGYEHGGWWVQELAASLPARLVPAEATRVLDACAAPGGKTMQLAARRHDVTALDLSGKRLNRLRENLRRTGLSADVKQGDLRGYKAEPFDAVLLDAPCSATGTFRRHPETLYRARPAIISEMAALQVELLDAAAALTRPGGSLVFATCSLEPEEGEEQVSAFLDRQTGWTIRPATAGPFEPAREGWLRILPGAFEASGGCDGFFIAHLVRDGE